MITIDEAYAAVLADTDFVFGVSWRDPHKPLSDAGKLFIIQMYREATGTRLLEDDDWHQVQDD